MLNMPAYGGQLQDTAAGALFAWAVEYEANLIHFYDLDLLPFH